MNNEKNANSKKRRIMMYIFIAIFAIAVIALGISYYQKNISSKGKQQIIQKAFDYVAQNLAQNSKIELGNIDKESRSFYRFIVKVEGREIPTYVSTDGKVITYNETEITETQKDNTTNDTTNNSNEETVGGFAKKDNEICKEDGKPIIYFFGSTSCPHCQWEKPIIQEIAKSYGDKISYHENIDSNNDMEVFNKFNSTGSIPTIIIGCQYYRIGSGEEYGEAKEKENLKTTIDAVLK